VVLSFSLYQGVSAEPNQQTKQMVDNIVSQLEAQSKILSDPKILAAQANQQYLYFQALIKAGFTEKQAMQLLVASAGAAKS